MSNGADDWDFSIAVWGYHLGGAHAAEPIAFLAEQRGGESSISGPWWDSGDWLERQHFIQLWHGSQWSPPPMAWALAGFFQWCIETGNPPCPRVDT